MEKSLIDPSKIRIEKLNKSHILKDFKSYERELVNFLQEDALNNQQQNLSVTFLWFYNNQLVSYITLLTDKINLEGDLKDFFREKDIHYKSLPALKIGRLCVDDAFLKQGLGRLMIQFSIQMIQHLNEKIAGCRFITLDAKRNVNKELDSIHFYKKMGFKLLKERKKGTTPMYIDVQLILNN